MLMEVEVGAGGRGRERSSKHSLAPYPTANEGRASYVNLQGCLDPTSDGLGSTIFWRSSFHDLCAIGLYMLCYN
jgi:hypothetical protein